MSPRPVPRPTPTTAVALDLQGPDRAAAAPVATPSKPAPDPILGKTIGGRYLVKSLIARGGMGRVYRAEQVPLGRICALKVLNPALQGDVERDFHKRFFLEASIAARLSHPNTVTIFDYGQADELYFIAMEYLEGRTLSRVIAQEGPFWEERAAHVARQICRSLREAHGLGVVHRDLKPGNVLLLPSDDDPDHVKVLDFGLVKDLSGQADKDLTETGILMGSPKYMAPEQIVGTPISVRTDIYALGVVMFEMLTGRAPFDRGQSFTTLQAHVHDEPPTLEHVHAGVVVSDEMRAIVYRCLSKDPAHRFGSMDELLGVLKRLPDASGTSASSMPPRLVPARPSTPGSGVAAVRSITATGALRPGSDPSLAPAPPAPHGSDGTRRVPMSEPAAASPASSSLPVASPAPVLDEPAPDFRGSSRRRAIGVVLAAVATGVALFAVLIARESPTIDAGAAPTSASAGADRAPTAPPSTGAASDARASASARSDEPAPGGAAAAPLLHLESVPSGASVHDGATEICRATPCDVPRAAASRVLSFDKRGFRTAVRPVAPGQERVDVRLDEAAAATGGAPRPSEPKAPEGYKPSPY